MIEETIPAALAGERLDRVVAMTAAVSRSEATALIDQARVRLNGSVVATRSLRVDAGARLHIEGELGGADPLPRPEPGAVEIVHIDDDVLVVDKPPGLVVHPGAGNSSGTLVNRLLHHHPEIAGVGDPLRPGIVHRLDKGTSGLLVVARSQRAHEALVDALASRRVERVYRTLVWGRLEADAGRIDAPLGRSQREPTRMAVTPRGREARTGYRVLGRSEEPAVTLLECRLETGRTHQIRVHLQSIGHPVVGDRRYGGDRETLPAPRPFLHATRLAFAHPVTGEPVEVESPLPDDLEAVVETLQLG